jgi:hypothetical protein
LGPQPRWFREPACLACLDEMSKPPGRLVSPFWGFWCCPFGGCFVGLCCALSLKPEVVHIRVGPPLDLRIPTWCGRRCGGGLSALSSAGFGLLGARLPSPPRRDVEAAWQAFASRFASMRVGRWVRPAPVSLSAVGSDSLHRGTDRPLGPAEAGCQCPCRQAASRALGPEGARNRSHFGPVQALEGAQIRPDSQGLEMHETQQGAQMRPDSQGLEMHSTEN